jgi:acyl-coenzyme A thioesterase PaaI-like protein
VTTAKDHIELTPLGDGVRLCASCIPRGRCRLGLRGQGLDADGVAHFHLECDSGHEGGPGVAHGGWTASVLDEMLGSVALLHKRLTVTKSLAVEFLLPVPINQPLLGRSWNARIEGHRWHNVGEITLAATGALLGRATGVFSERDPSHFQRHQDWLATQLGKPAG